MRKTIHAGTLLLLTLLIGVIITSCNNSSQPEKDSRVDLLHGKWKYVEIQSGSQTYSGDEMGSPLVEFQGDSTFFSVYGPNKDSGKWWLSGDSLFTQLTGEDGVEATFIQSLLIVKLSADTLKISAIDGGDNMTYTLVPATAVEEAIPEEQ